MKRFGFWHASVVAIAVLLIALIWLFPHFKLLHNQDMFVSIASYQEYLESRNCTNISVEEFDRVALIDYTPSSGLFFNNIPSVLLREADSWQLLDKGEYAMKSIVDMNDHSSIVMDCIYIQDANILTAHVRITVYQSEIIPAISDNRGTNFEVFGVTEDAWTVYECSFAVEQVDMSYVLQIDENSYDFYGIFHH